MCFTIRRRQNSSEPGNVAVEGQLVVKTGGEGERAPSTGRTVPSTQIALRPLLGVPDYLLYSTTVP